MRVLLAEDDKKVSAFLTKGLREEYYAVDYCDNGEDALFQAQVNEYDIIILDVMLPRKNGFTLCRELREEGNNTPILMLTVRDQLEDKLKGLHEGADDYMTKPFAFEELLARLKALMRRNQDYKTKNLSVGDLELDPVSRRVVRSGTPVNLTAREYALLEFLMRNKGRVVTQSKIIEHVWDMNFEGLSNVVNVYINHLREKIDRGHSRRYIHTVRGAGYKIDENENI